MRFRFSLRTLLIAVLAVGLCGSLAYQTHRRSVLLRENQTLRSILGELRVDDPSRFYSVHSDIEPEGQWRIRMFLPEATDCQLWMVVQGVSPQEQKLIDLAGGCETDLVIRFKDQEGRLALALESTARERVVRNLDLGVPFQQVRRGYSSSSWRGVSPASQDTLLALHTTSHDARIFVFIVSAKAKREPGFQFHPGYVYPNREPSK